MIRKLVYDAERNIQKYVYSETFDLVEDTGEVVKIEKDVKECRFITPVGSNIKPIYKFDKKTKELKKVDEKNLDVYINSFAAESDIKLLITKLQQKEISLTDFISDETKMKTAFYADVSEVPQTILENIELANLYADKFGMVYEDFVKTVQEQKVQPVEQPKLEEPKEEVK